MTRPRTGFTLTLLLTCASLCGFPAAAHATVRFHAQDAFYYTQWSLENGGSYSFLQNPAAQEDADIDAETAWDSGADGTGVTVAVVDTAIDTDVPDLKGRVDTSVAVPDFVTDGCTKYDVPTPDHGTAVAAVIAAEHDRLGIAGIAPGATILPVRALDNCGDGKLKWVLPALDFAAAHASIVVAAFGTPPGLTTDEQTDVSAQLDAVLNAHPDTLFVVPAGNEANDDDANPVYPCSSNAPNLICVGMTDPDDGPDCLGNYGQQSVDLFAPGQQIESVVRDGVARFTGTSMAAPMVAGVAALVESTWSPQDPELPPDPTHTATGLADALRVRPTAEHPEIGAVDARSALATLSVSGGRLNAAKALGLAPEDTLATQPADWVGCDGDHDGIRDTADACPTTAGSETARGCPDADGDGVQDTADACRDQPGPEELDGCPDGDGDGLVDGSDNCPGLWNPGQEDADRDGLGDACDSTPRGPDADGDGFGALDDQCPAQVGTKAGCPVYVPPPPPPYTPPVVVDPPPPVVAAVVAPRIVSVAVRVAHSRRSARVTVQLSRTLRAKVTVERRVRRHHHRVWSRVLRRSVTFTARGRHMTVRTRKRGSYRVTVRLTGAKTVRRNFRV